MTSHGSVETEQYFTTDEPGFVWKANIKAAPLFHISGRDKYEMARKYNQNSSLFTVADSRERNDQGTLLRYLAVHLVPFSAK